MSEFNDLYQELILDHNKRPRNRRAQPCPPGRHAEGHNPLCGDRVTVYLTMRDGVIADASFEGKGCAISTASASLMTEAVKGKTREEAAGLFERFHELVTTGQEPGDMGKLGAFGGVSEFPARVKCATLAWHTLQAALEDRGDPVSTE